MLRVRQIAPAAAALALLCGGLSSVGAAPTPGRPTVVGRRPPEPRRLRRSSARVVRHGDLRSKRVALTFDDGPSTRNDQTLKVLAVLRKHKVKATFFVLGLQAWRHPQLVRKIAAEGHELANHSWNHPRKLSYRSWLRQLRRTERAIRRAGVVPGAYYRPPHGIVRPEVRRACGRLGLTIVLYTLLSSDWRRPGRDALVRQVTRRLKGGGVAVLHDGGGDRRQTIAALPQIITGLRARGFELVRVDQLLRR